jgi:beta-lactamase regulating signal transducer with metallopeptidase domain
MLEFAVRVAFWWLPVVGFIGRQLRACEETCCDAAVVAQLPESRRDYAALLLDVIDFATPEGRVAVQATAMGAANDLEQRLRAILGATPRTRRSRLAQVVAVGLACAILPCGLHYDFVGRPTPAATSVGNEPAAGATPSPGSDPEAKLFSGCCPS